MSYENDIRVINEHWETGLELQTSYEFPNRAVSFRFLDLPGEIRNLIYEYMLILTVGDVCFKPKEVVQTLFEKYTQSPLDGNVSSFSTVVPPQPGFYAPWTAWLHGYNDVGEDRTIFNQQPAILAVSKAVAQEAKGLWRKLPLFLELHDQMRWRDFKISHRIDVMKNWAKHQDVDAMNEIKLIRIAVDWVVDDDSYDEPLWQNAEANSSGDDTEDPEYESFRCRRALFDIERTADSIIIKAGCKPSEDCETKLRAALEDVLEEIEQITAEALLLAAACIEEFSCVDDLCLDARREECVIKADRGYYLSYKDWKVIATIGVKARLNTKISEKGELGGEDDW